MTKDIVILTKSSKFGKYCVAGIDIQTSKWIRLVTSNANTHGALSDADLLCTDGSYCGPLDVVRVKCTGPAPALHQPENVMIKEGCRIEKRGVYNIQQVLRFHPAERHVPLYGNFMPYIVESELDGVNYSLTLIQVSKLLVWQTKNSLGNPKTKANFCYQGQWYNNISVTDPNYYNLMESVSLLSAYLVVSLPDAPFPDDQYYKFIAQIFVP